MTTFVAGLRKEQADNEEKERLYKENKAKHDQATHGMLCNPIPPLKLRLDEFNRQSRGIP